MSQHINSVSYGSRSVNLIKTALLALLAVLIITECSVIPAFCATGNTDKDTGDSQEEYVSDDLLNTLTDKELTELLLNDAYIEDDTDYYVTKEFYSMPYNDSYNFEIYYPQVFFRDGRNTSQLNSVIKECALASANSMYPKFSDHMLETLEPIGGPSPDYSKSTVNYHISYMTNDLLCIYFKDDYFLGSIFLEYHDARTCVFNMKTGQQYFIKDLLADDPDFLASLSKIVCEDYSFDPKEFDGNTVKDSWNYSTIYNRYHGHLYLSKYGVSYMLNYHYNDESLLTRGHEKYIIDKDNLKKYGYRSDIWKLIGQEDPDGDYSKIEKAKSFDPLITAAPKSDENNKDKLPKNDKDQRIYVVKAGDCLWAISRTYLGTGTRYMEITDEDSNTCPDIYPGTRLILPPN